MEQEKTPPQTPMELLAEYENAPSPAKVQAWKSQAPGGRLRLVPLPPDAKRAFLLRALSGVELAEISRSIPQNSSNPEYEIRLRIVIRCILWSTERGENPFSEIDLRAGTAGLVDTLHSMVQHLSDYHDPAFLLNYAVDF